MKKNLKRCAALLLAITLIVAVIPPASVSAASYPLVFTPVESVMTIPKGEIGVIRLCVFPEYKNEEYHVEIYNSAGQLVATAEDTYYNSSSAVRYFNITVNTNKLNMGVGTYTVKYWMSFYSLSEWHDAPNKYTDTFKVIPNVCGGNHNMVQEKVLTEADCDSTGSVLMGCTKCEHEYYQETPKTGHKYGAWTTYTSSSHKRTCSVCGDYETKSHSYSGSCDATCNDCGATRTATGSHTYTYVCDESCNVCGATRSVTHTYSSDCDLVCNICAGIRTSGAKHTFEGGYVCKLCNATFGDVDVTSWMIDHVVYVCDRGLMSGKGTDDVGRIKFDPISPITREEFVQVLYNAEGKPAVSIANRFPDVKDNGWYKNAVLWANSMNIANGMGNGNFGVGKNISRQDLALMLMKYAALKGCSLDAEAGKINQYADGNKVSDYAKNAMDWAVTNGVLSGKGAAGAPPAELRLDPTGTATRAECAAMLRNFMTAFGL